MYRSYWARPQGPFFRGSAKLLSGRRTIELEWDETAIVMKRILGQQPGADREGEAEIDVAFEVEE